MQTLDRTRRRFMTHFAGLGLASTLAPGILWARMQDAGAQTLTLTMVTDALKLSGIEATEEEAKDILESANRTLTQIEELRAIAIPNDVSPPFHFSAVVPGIEVDRTPRPFRVSAPPAVQRPANLEDAAFWPVRELAELVRTRQVTSLELTDMYLARLHRYNPVLNNVVTFLDAHGRAEARQADAEIAAGRYRGPLHGIPWGAKDIISLKGHKTTWGSPAFQEQTFDYDASVIEMLREAGAVLIAKLTTGELAAGDNWFGGQTKSPWDPAHGSSGSSAGPGSATAAGCVGFAIGTETSGSILSPAARCGVAGLRPTFGRISRYGVMALSWTMDRLGPMCRYAEDCALVMQAVAKPDGRDMSVSDVPFHWDAEIDIRRLRVGYIKESFDDLTNDAARANAHATLDTLRALGVTEFVPMTIPEISTNTSAINVEMAVFFDEHARSGRMDTARGGRRPAARLIPAVEYLRAQRIRMMMMMELARATEGLDVWVVASNNTGVGQPPRPAGEPTPPPRPPQQQPQGPAQRHSSMANLACYPAINVPNGFADTGTPTNATFFARPFGEAGLIALAKAYQDRAGFHRQRPVKLDEVTSAAAGLRR
ncbi:MAG: amidase [Vicinamibacterales bacterium]|nr:amidase [Vicinamibacterales bacterium]